MTLFKLAEQPDDPRVFQQPMCGWAPFSHEAPATHWLTLARLCGHQHGPVVASCADCTARVRTGPVAARATTCSTCGLKGPLTLSSARPIQP